MYVYVCVCAHMHVQTWVHICVQIFVSWRSTTNSFSLSLYLFWSQNPSLSRSLTSVGLVSRGSSCLSLPSTGNTGRYVCLGFTGALAIQFRICVHTASVSISEHLHSPCLTVSLTFTDCFLSLCHWNVNWYQDSECRERLAMVLSS